MAAEFIGCVEIQQVDPPKNSTLSFPVVLSAITGADIYEAHRALESAGISYADGSTPLIQEATTLKVARSLVDIRPIGINEGGDPDDAEAIMAMMDEEFEAGRTVTLSQPSPAVTGNSQPHWLLMTGYRKLDGKKDSIHTLDPSHRGFHYMGRHLTRAMLEGTVPAEASRAYALNVRPTRMARLVGQFKRGLIGLAEGFENGGEGLSY